jgi:hypothetical protein
MIDKCKLCFPFMPQTIDCLCCDVYLEMLKNPIKTATFKRIQAELKTLSDSQILGGSH